MYLVMDIQGNEIVPVVAGLDFISTEHASTILPDETAPILQSYNLNLDDLTLSFTFDEIVDSASLEETQLTFQDGVNGTLFYSLTDINRLTPDPSTVVETELVNADSVAIKSQPRTCNKQR